MKPLSVLLIHRDNDNYRNLTGWWSYSVPDFTWWTVKVPALDFVADVNTDDVDLIVLDDWIFGTVKKRGKKMAYVVVDSARSPAQLRRNQIQAEQADMILVDSDKLWKFSANGKPVRRFAYAVNDRLYHPREKTHDVAFLCWPTSARRPIRDEVEQICKRHNWSFLNGTYTNYQDYARAIGSAKIVVHKAHIEAARSWRVFDVMASQGCLLSSPLPIIDGDEIEPTKHYYEYRSTAELEERLDMLMTDNAWMQAANEGYLHVIRHHTWATRARELRRMIYEDLRL